MLHDLKEQKNDKYWLSVAQQIAMKSKCKKRQVGAVLVDIHGRVISTGYNGHPRQTCKDNICLREEIPSGSSMDLGFCCHAEMNAIIFADFKSMQEATLYLTHPPCAFCARHIMQAGITSLVYVNDGIERPDGLDLLRELLGGLQWFDMREYRSNEI